jgi:ABC-type antimicrobial peptide transport system permease subunit
VGLYGVIGYAVAQRTQEIGIRVALGARRSSILALVLGQGLRLAGAGVGIGMLVALSAGRWLRSELFGVDAFDPLTFAVTALVLLGAALLASYLPARRAMRVDPSEALRWD